MATNNFSRADYDKNRLRQLAANYKQDVKKHLDQLRGADGSRSMASQGFTPREWKNPQAQDRYEENIRRMGGTSYQYGTPATAADVRDFIAQTGGNPFMKQLSDRNKQTKLNADRNSSFRNAKGRATREAKKMLSDLRKQYKQEDKARKEQSKEYERFVNDTQAAWEEARNENLRRYHEIDQGYQDRYDRNMERVGNWGIAAAQDTNERFDEALGAQKADLASRGFGSSTMGAANIGRNARDRDRELQRISEARDSRAAMYDQQLSADRLKFQERREDTYPDQIQLAALAAKYGQSNAGQGFGGDRPMPSEAELIDELMNRYGHGQQQQQGYQPQTPQRYAGGMGGVTARGAAGIQRAMSSQLGGMYGAGMYALSGGIQPDYLTSNRYPEVHQRDPREMALARENKFADAHARADARRLNQAQITNYQQMGEGLANQVGDLWNNRGDILGDLQDKWNTLKHGFAPMAGPENGGQGPLPQHRSGVGPDNGGFGPWGWGDRANYNHDEYKAPAPDPPGGLLPGEDLGFPLFY